MDYTRVGSLLHHSNSHTDPGERRGDKRKDDDAYDLPSAVEAERTVPRAALRLRIEMREKMRFGQQQPIEADDIERFPKVEHHEETHKELPEREAVFDPVPAPINERADRHSNTKDRKLPAEYMLTGESLRMLFCGFLNVLRRSCKELLINPTAAQSAPKIDAIRISDSKSVSSIGTSLLREHCDPRFVRKMIDRNA